MQQHDSKYFVRRQILDSGCEVEVNDACSNMVASILPIDTPSTLIVWLKGKNFFSESSHVAYQIKGNGAKSTMQAVIFCPYTHPRPLGWGQKVKAFFSESSHVAYQVKWNHASTYSVLTHTLDPWGFGQKVKTFLNVVMLHIKLKGKKYRPK